MTVFRNQYDQSCAVTKLFLLGLASTTGKMSSRSVFVKLLFVSFLFVGRCYEETTDYLDVKEESVNNGVIRFMRIISGDQPVVVVVELKEPLLSNVKKILEKADELEFPDNKIFLRTFDKGGLQEKYAFNETTDFVRAILKLKPTTRDTINVGPVMHVLYEILQENLRNSTVILMTMSKPSDEDFSEKTLESLTGNQCQLSVLWAGDKNTDDWISLKNIANKTGGKFRFIMEDDKEFHDSIESEDLTSGNVEHFQNISARILFPQEKRNEAPAPRADQKAVQKNFVPLIVEIASGTSLETRPGTRTQIPFQVKNNLNLPQSVFFNAKFNGMVQDVQPPQAILQPSGSVTVVVNLQPYATAQTDAIGTLTFLAVGPSKVTPRQAYIFMTPQTTTDKTEPKIQYNYEGDCSNYKEPHNCENGHWSLRATIHDEDSGLLKILSEPYGLVFQSEFVAGTKSPVTVYYTASCCQPNVHIWAEDLRGNYMKKSFDVFNQSLLAGEIATIVLGVLLLLLIIIGIIVAVVLVRRRNRRNMIIPRARSGSR